MNIIYETETQNYIWIIDKKKIKTFSKIIQKKLTNKLSNLLNLCFKSKDEDEDKDDNDDYSEILKDDYIYCFYIDGKPKTTLKMISSIASIVLVQITSKYVSELWYICNDLEIKKGYMRHLINIIKLFLKSYGIKKIYLYLEHDNPYYKKALQLYKDKGFKKIDSNEFIIIMECKL